jgi:hypothetical protein
MNLNHGFVAERPDHRYVLQRHAPQQAQIAPMPALANQGR